MMGSSNMTFRPGPCSMPGCDRSGTKGSSEYASWGLYCSDTCAEAHRPIIEAEIEEWDKRRDRVERARGSRSPFVLVRTADLDAALARRPHSNPLFGY